MPTNTGDNLLLTVPLHVREAHAQKIEQIYTNGKDVMALYVGGESQVYTHIPNLVVLRLVIEKMSSRLLHSVGIRPMPRVQFRGKFMLCDKVRCRGPNCTYPHSVQELDAWNAEKLSSKYLISCATPT